MILDVIKIELKMIKIAKYEQTCIACPTQFDCLTDDGQYVYIRYRCGWLRAGIAADEKTFWDNWGKIERPYNIFNQEIGDDLDGLISFEEMTKILKDKVDFSNAINKYS